MPYMVKKEDKKFAVYKKGEDGKPTGERLGTHDTRDEANKQMAAIYVNEPGVGKKDMYDSMPMPMMKLEPDDPRAKYDPLGGNDTQACANCRWFFAREASCGLIWDEVVATGKCLLWLGEPPKSETMMQNPIAVVIVEPPTAETGSAEAKPAPVVQAQSKESPIIAWLKQTFGKKTNEPLTGTGFKALPNNRWVSFYTNNFEDKAGETFAEKAHDQYIAWLDKGEIPYPDLWYWHIPGTKHGQAEWIDRVDHVNVAVGTFDDTLMAQLFRKEYEKAPHTTSHTYGYPKEARQEGVYHAYFTIEISPLPAGKEANPYTTFTEVKEMPVTPEKITKLEAILGKDLASQVLGNAEKMSKELEAIGIKFKEVEGLPTVDADARAAIKELAIADKAALDTATKAMTDQLTAIATGIKALQDGEAARNKAVVDLETFVKEQFALQPRASRSQETIVPKDDPNAAFLAAKAADPNAGPQGGSVGEQIAGMIVNAIAKPAGS